MTKSALLEKGPKKSGIGRTPPTLIRTMSERKRFFSVDVFPKCCQPGETFQITWIQARFGFDITPTQPTGPCCPEETTTTTTTTTTTGAPQTCTCGLEGTTRIVGGEESTVSWSNANYSQTLWLSRLGSTLGSWPWISGRQMAQALEVAPPSCFLGCTASLFLLLLGCAATLVASNWAITAAHCVVDSGFTTKDDLSLVLGEFDISTSSDSNDGNRLKIWIAWQ